MDWTRKVNPVRGAPVRQACGFIVAIGHGRIFKRRVGDGDGIGHLAKTTADECEHQGEAKDQGGGFLSHTMDFGRFGVDGVFDIPQTDGASRGIITWFSCGIALERIRD